MSSFNINYFPKLLQFFIKNGVFNNDPLFLLDVGCSGGIDDFWHIYSDSLRAIGIDPLVNEINRLNGENKHPNISYVSGFVTSPEGCKSDLPSKGDEFLGFHPEVYRRLSSYRAMRLMNSMPDVVFNNGNKEVEVSDKKFSLDQFLSDGDKEKLSFLKIDTDGFDFDVLRGASGLLEKKNLLGIQVECQFHGHQSSSNIFSNIDILLNSKGYSLFEIKPLNYTRAALPGKFVYPIPAQTIGGQVIWGEALYFRDDLSFFAQKENRNSALKLISLYELFGFPDCAAELLLLLDVDHKITLLDYLAEDQGLGFESYEKQLNEFSQAPLNFYPQPR